MAGPGGLQDRIREDAPLRARTSTAIPSRHRRIRCGPEGHERHGGSVAHQRGAHRRRSEQVSVPPGGASDRRPGGLHGLDGLGSKYRRGRIFLQGNLAARAGQGRWSALPDCGPGPARSREEAGLGGGTRIKIYEGMAMGKATVSTRVGAEGLDVQHGRDIVLEDAPAAFADAIVTLLENEEVRRRYEAAAAATARKYDWSVIAQRFVEVLQRTIDAASGSRVTASSRAAGVRA